MTQITIDKLNKINKDFYSRISKYWNNKDNAAWFGWNTLLLIMQEQFTGKKEVWILDLGCGNARFATFVLTYFPDIIINYVGIDTDPQFLENGQERNKNDFGSFELIKCDLIKDNWQNKISNEFKSQKFDLVVLFGILHHIPSFESRQNLLNQAVQMLNHNGQIIFTGWRFLDKSRLKKRVISPKHLFYHHALNFFDLNSDELEDNDYLLDWVKYEYSIRYAHYISIEEAENMAEFVHLQIIKHFMDDSPQRDQNNYWVCQKI